MYKKKIVDINKKKPPLFLTETDEVNLSLITTTSLPGLTGFPGGIPEGALDNVGSEGNALITEGMLLGDDDGLALFVG